jgi:hypothetical protein
MLTYAGKKKQKVVLVGLHACGGLTDAILALARRHRGAQFTCFTSTKVQILTAEALLESPSSAARAAISNTRISARLRTTRTLRMLRRQRQQTRVMSSSIRMRMLVIRMRMLLRITRVSASMRTTRTLRMLLLRMRLLMMRRRRAAVLLPLLMAASVAGGMRVSGRPGGIDWRALQS